MKTIEIKTQSKFDNLPDKFSEYTHVQVTENLQQVTRTPKNSYISVCGSATIEYVCGSATIKSVCGSATIESVCGSATIECVCDSATIKSVCDSATIKSVRGSATIKSVCGSATIECVYDSATIKYVCGSATIEYVCGSATIKSVCGSATIESVCGSATIESVCGSATIKSVCGSATIEYVCGSATIECVYDSATIEYVRDSATIECVSMNAVVRVFSVNVNIRIALDFAVIIGIGIKKFIRGRFDKTVAVLFRDLAEYNQKNLSGALVKTEKGKAILYKIVRSDYTNCGHFDKSVKYTVGKTVTCPDWIDAPEKQCGNGLHLSKTIKEASGYHDLGNGNRILKCLVSWRDINIYQKDISKFRCKKVFVECEVNEKGEPINA